MSTGTLDRLRAVHPCVDCRELPADQLPARPRPLAGGGPRSGRCATHLREHRRAIRARNRDYRREKVYGLTPARYAELVAFQDGRDPICGRSVEDNGQRRPATDHDHACCPGALSCGQCVRGILCNWCNYNLLGRYSRDQLAAAVDYYDNPPFRRMLAEQGDPAATRALLRAERERIERRQYADLCRLEEIRGLLDGACPACARLLAPGDTCVCGG